MYLQTITTQYPKSVEAIERLALEISLNTAYDVIVRAVAETDGKKNGNGKTVHPAHLITIDWRRKGQPGDWSCSGARKPRLVALHEENFRELASDADLARWLLACD